MEPIEQKAEAFAMAILAKDQYNADRSPRPGPTGSGESTSMVSLAASNERSPPGAWNVRCKLYFFGDGVKYSEKVRAVSLGFQLKLKNIHGAARRMTISDTVKMITTIPQ